MKAKAKAATANGKAKGKTVSAAATAHGVEHLACGMNSLRVAAPIGRMCVGLCACVCVGECCGWWWCINTRANKYAMRCDIFNAANKGDCNNNASYLTKAATATLLSPP